MLGLDVVRKHQRLQAQPGGGIAVRPVEAALESAPALNTDQMARLAEMAHHIENYFKTPRTSSGPWMAGANS